MLRWLLPPVFLLAVAVSCGGDDAGESTSATPMGESTANADAATTPTEAAAEVEPPDEPGAFAVGVTTLEYVKPSVTDGSDRPLEVVVWYPSEVEAPVNEALSAVIDAAPAADAPFPLVIFSHGSGGNPRQSTFLTTHLATHGFVVAAVGHTGNTTEDCFPCTEIAALANSFANRPADVEFVRDQLLAESSHPILGGLIDGEQIGISGHSFGGYTTMAGLAAGGFDAGAAMAPAAEFNGNVLPLPTGPEKSIDEPVLIMSGRLDTTTPYATAVNLYDRLTGSEDKFLVELPHGTHMSFSAFCLILPDSPGCGPPSLNTEEGHRLIQQYVTAFFRYYLNGEEEYLTYLLPGNEPSEEVVVVETSVAGDPGN